MKKLLTNVGIFLMAYLVKQRGVRLVAAKTPFELPYVKLKSARCNLNTSKSQA